MHSISVIFYANFHENFGESTLNERRLPASNFWPEQKSGARDQKRLATRELPIVACLMSYDEDHLISLSRNARKNK